MHEQVIDPSDGKTNVLFVEGDLKQRPGGDNVYPWQSLAKISQRLHRFGTTLNLVKEKKHPA